MIGYSLGAIVDRICPERGQYEFIIGTYEEDFDSVLGNVRAILKRHNCQVDIRFNANELNHITIFLESYVLHHRGYRCYNWGYHFDALAELCDKYRVWMYSETEYGYEFNKSQFVTHEWQAEGAE